MREGISKIQCLLGVELYEVSANFICKLRETHKHPEEAFDYLPEFTLGEKNNLVRAEEYHQFIGFEMVETPEVFLYFDLRTLDRLLQNEIDNSGLEDLFKDQKFLRYLMPFKPEKQENISNFVFPHVNYLIVELTYETTYDSYSGGYDCEMNAEIVGYLSGNFSPQFFE
jgi:hypothetical protein